MRFISSFDSQCNEAQEGSHLERFDVRGVRRSHIETLHVGLEHALCDWKRDVTV